MGEGALVKLAQSTVMVVGLGGVGSWCAEMLCRAGVGHLVLVDGDTVDSSNRNRQLPALATTIGMRKVEVQRFPCILCWRAGACAVQAVHIWMLRGQLHHT